MNETEIQQLITAHARRQKLSPEFSATLAKELALTAETLAVQLTALRVAGFAEALAGMNPKIMSLGFRKARRECEYFPKPKQVREWVAEELERLRPRYQGLPEPQETPEQKAKLDEEFKAAWVNIAGK